MNFLRDILSYQIFSQCVIYWILNEIFWVVNVYSEHLSKYKYFIVLKNTDFSIYYFSCNFYSMYFKKIKTQNKTLITDFCFHPIPWPPRYLGIPLIRSTHYHYHAHTHLIRLFIKTIFLRNHFEYNNCNFLPTFPVFNWNHFHQRNSFERPVTVVLISWIEVVLSCSKK